MSEKWYGPDPYDDENYICKKCGFEQYAGGPVCVGCAKEMRFEDWKIKDTPARRAYRQIEKAIQWGEMLDRALASGAHDSASIAKRRLRRHLGQAKSALAVEVGP